MVWHIRCFVPSRTAVVRWLALVLLFTAGACAHKPKQRYGIEKLSFVGMKALDPNALRACLVTEQRDKVTLGLGAIISPDCGVPPFDKTRINARLFALPWAQWPVYDEAVFKLDVERIERWYQARGYYGVRVLDVAFKPTEARQGDVCSDDKGECEIQIEVRLEEGEPVKVRKVELDIEGKLDPKLVKRINAAIQPKKGDIFDEALYDEGREKLADVVREAGYARAAVVGNIEVNRGLLVADIKFVITPGPLCHFGEVKLTSKSKIPEEPILAATLLRKGQLYQESALDDAQRSIYALGAFSAVTVKGDLEHSEGAEVPILINVEPRRESQWLVGGGILSGIPQNSAAAIENISVPQWDVHLVGSYENRNFVGGLRKFKIEERPRMLFMGQFPSVPDNSPRFGNTISANFSQPGVIDGRTALVLDTSWDNGPDPFLLFFRNDIGVALGLERGFWRQRINMRVAIHQEIMRVSRRQPIRDDVSDKLNARWEDQYSNEMNPNYTGMMAFRVGQQQALLIDEQSSYVLPFVEQRITVDLRDDAVKPSKGGYLRLLAHEAFRLPDTASWNYIRLTPEARGYVPLGLGIVLAGKFEIGWIKILNASDKLDDVGKLLGPTAYRLRGGGATSNRGFAPGRLGDSFNGGTHRWGASLELRVPLSTNFYIVGFSDIGDVNAGADLVRFYDPAVSGNPRRGYDGVPDVVRRSGSFRWDHINGTLGAGLRYYTVIGPVRLDVGYRPKWYQGNADNTQTMDLGRFLGGKFNGAVQLTIGDAF
ncbi:MAG: BamA/TamA family outer membrane protein [Polyangiales bacterium]